MKISRVFILLLYAVFVLSCEDIVQEDLDGRKVHILCPVEGTKLSTLSVTFWWDAIDGADSYRVQIVQPSFDAVQKILTDTNVSGTQFIYSLSAPGNFEWRIKPFNNSSQGIFSSAHFEVDSSLTLSTQQVTLVSPAADFQTIETSIQFTWTSLFNADVYRLELLDGITSSVLYDTVLGQTSVYLTMDTGRYIWKVRAENDISSTPYSQRNLYIDQTPPAASVPDLPAYGDTINNPVTLSWSRAADAVADSLFIYSDSTLSIAVVAGIAYDTTYDFTGTLYHSYFWKLKSIDVSGNVGNASGVSRFYIIP